MMPGVQEETANISAIQEERTDSQNEVKTFSSCKDEKQSQEIDEGAKKRCKFLASKLKQKPKQLVRQDSWKVSR